MRSAWQGAGYRDLRRHGRALVVIPILLLIIIVVIDILNGPTIHLGPLLIVGPAITASFAGPRLVALIGVLAVGGDALTAQIDRWRAAAENETHIVSLAVVSALIVFFCAVRERHQRQLTKVRKVAEVAQHVLIRPLPERSGPLRIACSYLTADQEARIGGDLYVAARTRCGTRLIIGDVRGKGLEAIDTAALVAGAFRAAAHQRATLPDLLAFLDGAISFDSAGGSGPDPDERFVTALALDIPDDDTIVQIVNRGHPPPLRLRDDRVTELGTPRPALPLGLGGLYRVEDDVVTFAFKPGDLLLLYTDGVIEARDPAGRFYPLAERVASWPGHDPAALVTRLRDDLLTYVGGRLGDDAAMIAVERSH